MYTGFLDYLVLGILSLAMFIYAYYKRPEGDFPPDDDDSDGGLPPNGDTYPVDVPPSLVYPQADTTETVADGRTPEPTRA